MKVSRYLPLGRTLDTPLCFIEPNPWKYREKSSNQHPLKKLGHLSCHGKVYFGPFIWVSVNLLQEFVWRDLPDTEYEKTNLCKQKGYDIDLLTIRCKGIPNFQTASLFTRNLCTFIWSVGDNEKSWSPWTSKAFFLGVISIRFEYCG